MTISAEGWLMRAAQDIEHVLLEKGYPLAAISGILGAAFVSSLANLPRTHRVRLIASHLEGLEEIHDALMAVPDPSAESIAFLRHAARHHKPKTN